MGLSGPTHLKIGINGLLWAGPCTKLGEIVLNEINQIIKLLHIDQYLFIIILINFSNKFLCLWAKLMGHKRPCKRDCLE